MNVMMVGVGGQGVLTGADILARSAMARGFDVKVSEVHGMAQRGGSVYSHVRYSRKVRSPLIMMGEADIILAFERVESLRFAHYAKPDGLIIVNNQRLDPVTVSSGQFSYPEDIFERLKALPQEIHVVDGESLAANPATRRSVNFLLIGALAARTDDIPQKIWEQTITEAFSRKPKALEANLEAFHRGFAGASRARPKSRRSSRTL